MKRIGNMREALSRNQSNAFSEMLIGQCGWGRDGSVDCIAPAAPAELWSSVTELSIALGATVLVSDVFVLGTCGVVIAAKAMTASLHGHVLIVLAQDVARSHCMRLRLINIEVPVPIVSEASHPRLGLFITRTKLDEG